MKYDFTSVCDRKGRDAIAIDAVGGGGMAPQSPREGFDVIPMWVADMSFPTAPSVIRAIINRAEHPYFGYFAPSREYYDAIISWQTERNGVTGLKNEHIGYENGVLGGVISALNAICSRGDKVLVHSPTYVGFTGSLGNSGYNIIHSPLKQDEKGVWRMDFEDMEEKIVRNNIHAMVFCSPHNPTGRVWERWELEETERICKKHSVFVVSDEIWSDIVLNGNRHIPFQSVGEYAREHTVALYAPSKTFNLAGLIGSYHIIYGSWLRERVRKEASLSHYNSMNVLSMHALIGAYSSDGRQWTDELRQVLSDNVNYACEYINTGFRGVEVSKPQGTYVLFPDCEKWCREKGKTVDDILKAGWDVGVAWQDGRPFHGAAHLRMNLALPMSRLKEALDRLDKYVFNA